MQVGKEILENKKISKYYGSLYEDLKTDNTFALSYHLVFILRRIFMCIIYLYWTHIPGQQI